MVMKYSNTVWSMRVKEGDKKNSTSRKMCIKMTDVFKIAVDDLYKRKELELQRNLVGYDSKKLLFFKSLVKDECMYNI